MVKSKSGRWVKVGGPTDLAMRQKGQEDAWHRDQRERWLKRKAQNFQSADHASAPISPGSDNPKAVHPVAQMAVAEVGS